MNFTSGFAPTASNTSAFIVSCKSVAATPFEGIGKPEALKGVLQGFCSRRVNDEDRVVYEVSATEIIVHSLKGLETV